jgi:archaellum component FlaC
MLEEHKEDREIFKQTIEKIVDRLDKVEDDVAYIKGRIENGKQEEF